MPLASATPPSTAPAKEHVSVSSYQNRYAQYKHDTAELATWLARAAVQAGYPLSEFCKGEAPPEQPPDTSAPRLIKETIKTANQEKNARKRENAKAKKAAASSGGTGTGGQTGGSPPTSTPAADNAALGARYTLSTAQFLSLSHYLVDKSFTVPNAVLRLLRRCIALRLGCAKRFRHIESESNSTHRHFTETLIETSRVLASICETGQIDSAEAAANRFAALDMEEAEETEFDDEEDSSDIHLPAAAANTERVETADLSFRFRADLSEIAMLGVLFFEDFARVRAYLRDRWQAYADGQVDLTTVSVITNTALELLLRSCKDLESRALRLLDDRYDAIFCYLHSFMMGPDYLAEKHELQMYYSVDDSDSKTIQSFEFLCIPVFEELVRLFKWSDRAGSMVIPSPILRADKGFAPDGQADTFSQRCERMSGLIHTFVCGYWNFTDLGRACLENAPGQAFLSDDIVMIDHTARAFQSFRETRDASISLVVCAQVWLDINAHLGSKASAGLDTLRRTTDHMSLGMHRWIEECSRAYSTPSSWSEGDRGIVTDLQWEIETWRMNLELGRCRSAKDGSGTDEIIYVDETERWRFSGGISAGIGFQCSPMICGLTAFRFQTAWRWVVMGYCTAWCSIFSAAYLYYASNLHRLGHGIYEVILWPEMDTFLDMHGREGIFGGKVPDNQVNLRSNFYLKLGVSLADMRSLKHRPQSLRPKETVIKCPEFKDSSQIFGLLRSMYVRTKNDGNRTGLDALLEKLSDIRSHTDNSPSVTRRKASRRRKQPLSLLDTLDTMEATIKAEKHLWEFDYFGLHQLCIKVLRASAKERRELLGTRTECACCSKVRDELSAQIDGTEWADLAAGSAFTLLRGADGSCEALHSVDKIICSTLGL